jgi:hypothetical protein
MAIQPRASIPKKYFLRSIGLSQTTLQLPKINGSCSRAIAFGSTEGWSESLDNLPEL